MSANTWLILTGEYPPQVGGVSDYTAQVAQALTSAGDDVHVWAPACEGSHETAEKDHRVEVHRLAGCFSRQDLTQIGATIGRMPAAARLLIQYVPHAFGYKAMNLAFARWVAKRRDRSVDVMFHEVAYPLESGAALRHRLLAVVTRYMARRIGRRANRIFVSTPGWEPLLRTMIDIDKPITWLPVPANATVRPDRACVQQIRQKLSPDGRQLIGHFGTYGPLMAPILRDALPLVLARGDRAMILIGRGSDEFARQLLEQKPELVGRVVAVGAASSEDVAAHLAACDVLLQPYPDGASARRSSLMAGLALGAAVVSNHGHVCDTDRWRDPKALAMAPDSSGPALAATLDRVVGDAPLLADLRARAARQYADQFAIEHTIAILRSGLQPSHTSPAG